MVSEHGISTYGIFIFMFTNDNFPPLVNKIEDIESGREEGEEVNSEFERIREKLGFKDMEDTDDLNTLLKSCIEDMTKNFMQGF